MEKSELYDEKAAKRSYLMRFFADLLGFGVNGAGGALSILRSTSSAFGCALDLFVLFIVM